MRHLHTAEDIFAALVEHLRFATSGGKIRSTITIFAPQAPAQLGIRIWLPVPQTGFPQLIRYAGYRQSDGRVIGDPHELTERIQHLGWHAAAGTPFGILPLVISMPHQSPKLFELPPGAILEVPLTQEVPQTSRPHYDWFAELGLKWHALPIISNMCLEIGGISYTAAPFNGWYMGTEIGARNLADTNRYNLLPLIAQKIGLDTRSDRTLWKDRALVELNIAVLSSFAQHNVTIVDHHTASRQFLLHDEQEHRMGRTVPAHWPWIVPPLSGSASPILSPPTHTTSHLLHLNHTPHLLPHHLNRSFKLTNR